MRTFRVVVNGSAFEVTIEEIEAGSGPMNAPTQPVLQTPGQVASPSARVSAAPALSRLAAASAQSVIAQMPGTIVAVEVAPGDRVSRGQTLLILEAMKMANEIVAPHDGTIGEVRAAKGASVNAGDVLVMFA